MNINGKNVNYEQYGQGNIDVVLLHGWGQNIEMMRFISQNLHNARVTLLDFPGFGKSEEPDEPMNVGEYADWLKKLLDLLSVENPVLVGHSFGGRVAIKYAVKYPTRKVVLLASPIIRAKHNKPKEKIYKIVKKTPFGEYFRKKWGSADYNNASPVMRQTMVKVVNEDLLEDAKKIEVPTIFLSGKLDEAVDPKLTAKAIDDMQKAGVDVALIEQNGNHFAYCQNPVQTCSTIDAFINYPNDPRLTKKM